MTAVPVAVEAYAPEGRFGRWAARAIVVGCAMLFVVGLVLWARDERLTATMWLLPAVWSEAGLRDAARGLGVSVTAVSSYFMLLELLSVLAGLTAATLLLRGATTWFRRYAAVAIALWVTFGGTMPAVFGTALDARSGGYRNSCGAWVGLRCSRWRTCSPMAGSCHGGPGGQQPGGALRPPELDELGLAHAIEAAGARLPGLHVDVVAEDLTDLEPAIEAAAYRIAVEALTNAARHSGASSATARLAIECDTLALSIVDRGCGIPPATPLGTGTRSMRERVAEVGGSFEMSPLTGGGTCVRANLPVGRFS